MDKKLMIQCRWDIKKNERKKKQKVSKIREVDGDLEIGIRV